MPGLATQKEATMRERSAELAVGWIEAWKTFDMEWLRNTLAPDFVHVSPFGSFDDRESYLAVVEPLARKSVMELSVKETIASGNQAAIRFENRTPKGVVESCDWVRVEGDHIKEIRSFYDSAKIREILSATEQESLGPAPGP
jgi:ketosteroid isomerase-like protein